MGPRVKFAVDPAATQMMDKQLISNDLGERDRIQWMVFKLGNESWDLVGHGAPSADFFEKMLSHVPKSEGRHLVFRSANEKSDVWVKYIPEDAPVKERTHFATASDSLFDDTRGTKVRLEIRDYDELVRSNPLLAPYV